MIQRAVTAIIGVVIGLFATFAVFGAILGGLDNFYLLTRHACNFGTEASPDRLLRVYLNTSNANTEAITRTMDPNDVDWDYGYDIVQGSGTGNTGYCTLVLGGDTVAAGTHLMMTPTGEFISVVATGAGLSTNQILDDSDAVVTSVTPEISWIEAEGVFTAQGQLVTLLAVIAAIGMPLGAMTAVVFFGQAVVSSGVSGQGASQVLVAIAAVVIILVAVQMFQQFAGYLGDAFDAVNGNRFVVFNETLGSLAETIAEFWGVLAFAGLINIATIVWRNYNGNMSIGGLGDSGGGGRGL